MNRTHYLRTKKNESIVDVESYPTDITSVVCIDNYTKFLLKLPEDKRMEFSDDMYAVQELRGEYHEHGLETLMTHASYLVKNRLQYLARKWDLYYVED